MGGAPAPHSPPPSSRVSAVRSAGINQRLLPQSRHKSSAAAVVESPQMPEDDPQKSWSCKWKADELFIFSARV